MNMDILTYSTMMNIGTLRNVNDDVDCRCSFDKMWVSAYRSYASGSRRVIKFNSIFSVLFPQVIFVLSLFFVDSSSNILWHSFFRAYFILFMLFFKTSLSCSIFRFKNVIAWYMTIFKWTVCLFAPVFVVVIAEVNENYDKIIICHVFVIFSRSRNKNLLALVIKKTDGYVREGYVFDKPTFLLRNIGVTRFIF